MIPLTKLCQKCTYTLCRCSELERACSDCAEYSFLVDMIEMPDSRLVCTLCKDKARNLSIERSQIQLFRADLPFLSLPVTLKKPYHLRPLASTLARPALRLYSPSEIQESALQANSEAKY